MPSKSKKGSHKSKTGNGKPTNGATTATPRRRVPPLAVAAVAVAAAAVGVGYVYYDADASRADAALACYARGDAACPNAPTCGVVVAPAPLSRAIRKSVAAAGQTAAAEASAASNRGRGSRRRRGVRSRRRRGP